MDNEFVNLTKEVNSLEDAKKAVTEAHMVVKSIFTKAQKEGYIKELSEYSAFLRLKKGDF